VLGDTIFADGGGPSGGGGGGGGGGPDVVDPLYIFVFNSSTLNWQLHLSCHRPCFVEDS
jgi:hypothetical protein